VEFNISLDQARVIADTTRTAGFRFILAALETHGDELLAQALAAETNEQEHRLMNQLRAYARVIEILKTVRDQVQGERPIDDLDPFDAAETLSARLVLRSFW